MFDGSGPVHVMFINLVFSRCLLLLHPNLCALSVFFLIIYRKSVILLYRCGPCKMVAPHFMALASKHKTKAVFVKVDVDNAKDVAQKYQVRSMPTFMFFHKGVKVEEFSGAQVSKLTETVERLIKSCSRKTFPSPTLACHDKTSSRSLQWSRILFGIIWLWRIRNSLGYHSFISFWSTSEPLGRSKCSSRMHCYPFCQTLTLSAVCATVFEAAADSGREETGEAIQACFC